MPGGPWSPFCSGLGDKNAINYLLSAAAQPGNAVLLLLLILINFLYIIIVYYKLHCIYSAICMIIGTISLAAEPNVAWSETHNSWACKFEIISLRISLLWRDTTSDEVTS